MIREDIDRKKRTGVDGLRDRAKLSFGRRKVRGVAAARETAEVKVAERWAYIQSVGKL